MSQVKRQRKKLGKQARREALARDRKRQGIRRRFVSALAVAAVIFATFAFLHRTTTSSTPKTKVAKGCPAADGSAKRKVTFSAAPPQCISADKTYVAHFTTSQGEFNVKLNSAKAFNTVNNFVVLTLFHYYDNNKVFRLAPGIDIWQSGSPHTQTNADPGPGYTIADEGKGFTYKTGELVMARTSQPNSAGGQFFFTTGTDAKNLNASAANPSGGTYVPLGTVTKGLSVVQKIGSLYPSGQTSYDGAPTTPVTIKSVTILGNNGSSSHPAQIPLDAALGCVLGLGVVLFLTRKGK